MTNYKIIELEQGSPSWLAFRKNHITATDTASILGIAYKKTALHLWEEKLGLRDTEPENDAMREGKRLEEEARDFWNNKIASDFKPVVLVSTTHEFMMASLDGMNSKGEILEIKCGKASHEIAKEHEVAPYYFSQLQKQMYVSGVQFVGYLSYRSKEDYVYFVVDRDDAFIEKMIEAEKEFYRCMMEFTSPPAAEKDYVLQESKEWRLYAEVWKETKHKLEEYKEKERALREELIRLANGESSQGSGIKLTKCSKPGCVDYSRIEILKDVDLSAYRRKNIEYWRISENE